MFETVALHKQLIEKALPSGFEGNVAEYIAELARPFADEVRIDALGNVIAHKKGPGEKVMLAAHMDLIGFMVSHIDEQGYLRLETIGGHRPAFLHRTRVRFANGVRGVIMCEKWAEEQKKNMEDVRAVSLYIDIGAGSREKAMELVRIGDVAVFDGELHEQNGMVLSPYADDLIACVVLLRVMEKLKTAAYDTYFVFTVQEEVGIRGAATSAYGIHPDFGVAVDVCGTGDTPSAARPYCDVKLGKGATVKLRDMSLLCDPYVVEKLRKAADKAKVTYQDEILIQGGTDAGAIQRSHGYIMAGGVSIPTRNVHSPREIYSLSDVDGAVSILHSLLKK